MGNENHPDTQPLTPASKASYMGWRLRPKGFDWGEGLQDRDPRGREGVRGWGIGDGEGTPSTQPLSPDSRFHERSEYVELHCHTCYSFREGASSTRQLLTRARRQSMRRK